MSAIGNPVVLPTARHHKRTPTAVLRSMVTTRSRTQNQTKSAAVERSGNSHQKPTLSTKILPVILPVCSNGSLPSDESSQNRERTRSSLKKPVEIYDEEKMKSNGLHIRNKSFVASQQDTPGGNGKIIKDRGGHDEKEHIPKKSKSSRSLSTFLTRSKSSNDLQKDGVTQAKDKENRTPPGSANAITPPIWSQFASQQVHEISSTTKVPLNDRWDVQDELDFYTPKDYSPSKGRNFGNHQPTLTGNTEPKPRPKSGIFTSSVSTTSLIGSVLRKTSSSSSRKKSQSKEAKVKESKFDGGKSTSRSTSRPATADRSEVSNDYSTAGITLPKRGSRVMAQVAALDGKEKIVTGKPLEAKPNPAEIDAAFEQMLDSRDTPYDLRQKMRALDTNMKVNLIKQSEFTTQEQASQNTGSSRPGTGLRAQTDDGVSLAIIDPEPVEKEPSPKKARPRSLTFTLGKGDQSKKQKSDRPVSHGRNKSADLQHSASSRSLSSTAHALSFLGKSSKPAIPEDFISYLRKVQKPQQVEVGRLQKLRQLLRNETVTWVDLFIAQGGMTEIVGLLYRIIEIEWREEHEDTLLHHTLTCLKALLTTSLALTHLATLQPTLFPTLLRLLFSFGDDKKGPSEYSTRSVIISLLNTYLSTSPSELLYPRAQTLLSYLRDPAPAPERQPLGFVAEMHRPRPYKVWCKEFSNVTKEVFWIFIHNCNIIPYHPPDPSCNESFAATFFPAPLPPVPAAPYVGSVEWDATTYLTAHLDLINGIIASLPDRSERNSLRRELRDSGFEKVMGTSLRTCKEKFYAGVHAGLATWVAAGREDGWHVQDVKEGPPREETRSRGVSRSPKKKDAPPRLDLLGLEVREEKGDAWL